MSASEWARWSERVDSISDLCRPFLLQIPNGFWIVVPLLLSLWFGRELSNLLLASAGLRQWNPVDHTANTKIKST